MNEFLGVDWQIDAERRDLMLDGVGEPVPAAGRACLAQDLRHRLVTSVDVLGFIHKDLRPGEIKDLENLVELEAERDPRVTARSAKGSLRTFDAASGALEIGVEFLPIGSDRPENMIVRVA